jgi:hypothetical protein
MTDMITLVVPFGAESAPICSHDRGFQPYLEDPSASIPRWLVDVTPEAAHQFLSTGGGFHLYEPQLRRRLSGETTPLVHADGPVSVSFDGDNHQSAQQVMPNGATVHVLAVPTEAVLDFIRSHPGFSVLSVMDYQQAPEVAAIDDVGGDAGDAEAAPQRGKRGKRDAE